jgi:adenine/guanine phosphoribosyltransferase-like PRPP-binding protein
VLADDRRAQRFLDLTGLTPEQLRERIESAELQLSVLDFLCAHEPDLIAAGEALGVAPAAIAAAREELAR